MGAWGLGVMRGQASSVALMGLCAMEDRERLDYVRVSGVCSPRFSVRFSGLGGARGVVLGTAFLRCAHVNMRYAGTGKGWTTCESLGVCSPRFSVWVKGGWGGATTE